MIAAMGAAGIYPRPFPIPFGALCSEKGADRLMVVKTIQGEALFEEVLASPLPMRHTMNYSVGMIIRGISTKGFA
jgi:hypothetical protein